MQDMICHHAEILRFVYDDMMRLADDLRFLYQLVKQGKRRKIVDIKGVIRKRDGISLFTLF